MGPQRQPMEEMRHAVEGVGIQHGQEDHDSTSTGRDPMPGVVERQVGQAEQRLPAE